MTHTKMLFPTILSVLMILGIFSSSVSSEYKDPIDTWSEECTEKNYTTPGMVECAGTAYKKWDTEMNTTYKKLMKKLKPKDQKMLLETQKSWLKYRDLDLAFSDEANSYKMGTIWGVIIAGNKVSIVKERTLRLRGYLDSVSGQ